MIDIPSPAIAIVGRHNSGKTTLIEKLIASLVSRGHDVGSVKHHSHPGFEIDYPGKDSYRHRAAGASETVIACPNLMARIKDIDEEPECSEILRTMPGHDIVVVEGYRKSGLPTIELMRAGNNADESVAELFLSAAQAGEKLGADHVQAYRQRAKAAQGLTQEEIQDEEHLASIANKLPTANTVAVVSDIPAAQEAAQLYNIPCFGLEDIDELSEFLEELYVRPRITVVIQAGGESRRMGRSKATVPFAGRPLICRIIERVAPAADELIITTNEPENLSFVDELYPELNIRKVSDAYEYRGALPGLYTALSAAHNPYVAVVACDMVFASASLVVAESLVMAETGADVVVPVNKHGYEPFHALYRRAVCLPSIIRGLDKGEKRAQVIFNDPAVQVEEFPQEKVLEVEPHGGCFINANTPDELAHLEDSFLGN